jgi:hypothetical protein
MRLPLLHVHSYLLCSRSPLQRQPPCLAMALRYRVPWPIRMTLIRHSSITSLYFRNRSSVIALKTFRVSHFGVGKQFLVKHSDGSITSVAGAVVSGTVSIDISSSQRQALLAQTTNDFGVQSPKLLPLRLANPKVESIVLDKVVGFGDTVQQSLPSTFQVGSEVAFSVGSLNSGFAQVVANLAQGTTAGMVSFARSLGRVLWFFDVENCS